MPDLDDEVSLVRLNENDVHKMSLFEAVRKWSDSEGDSGITIELGGKKLNAEEVNEIAESKAFKERLLAFNDRR